ncbi:uncharacterized protein LOC129287751 [Prosopis cineraria]|uniref:uncharacterized protein LOC129287751 n=1 Tax=Prosopis cineraria TaxID=364024 RepID=UPI00240FDB01|nr:uncharacterized protein LOC129287751 [Prosopis cineraria]
MEFLSFAVAAGGFILIGAHEAFNATISNSTHIHSPSPLSTTTSSKSNSQIKKTPAPSSLSFLFVSVFSFFAIVNSLVSLVDAQISHDPVGSALQWQVLAVALIFLLYSVLGLMVHVSSSLYLPSSLLGLVGAFAFVEEFLLFYLQRKDPSGVENRYYDLLLVPIAVCVFSTICEFHSPTSNLPRLTRGFGLILQGTWFLQMGLSFFTSWMAHGCSVRQVSRGNYTLWCKGHPEFHRGRAIATLQFNCHLALMVALFVGFFSTISWKNGIPVDSTQYRPIGSEMQSFQNSAQFTLDSDGDSDEEIKEDKSAMKKSIVVESGMNGFGSHH